MKKILTLAILLLTLPMVMRNVTGYGVAVAQDLINEEGYDCYDEVIGHYISPIPCDGAGACREKCPSCECLQDCDDIAAHKETCYHICSWCDLKMDVKDEPTHECQNDPDDSDCNKNCVFCGMPLDQCICPGPVIEGKGPRTVPGGGGGTPPPTPNPPYTPDDRPILHSPDTVTTNNDSLSYHRCPCMVTSRAKDILNNMKNSPWYNQDNGYPGLTEDLKRQVAFPETIQQGRNGTCAAAVLQKFLAENFPEQYIECVYSLANYGYYEPWGLRYDFLSKSGSPFGITQVELDAENFRLDDAKRLGNQYTSVDALMQSALQSWANRNSKPEELYDMIVDKIAGASFSIDLYVTSFQPFGYDPRKDDGDGGGMTFRDAYKFITENVANDSYVEYSKKGKITYDYLDDKLYEVMNDDYNSYTVFASVDMVQGSDGKYFGNGRLNHMLEISKTQSGKIRFWSYGNEFTTSERNCPVGDLMIIKKTDYAKREKMDRQSLACHCNDCSGDGCSKCMSK